jgi:hypothetical protein
VNSQTLPCPNCRTALPETLFNSGGFGACPTCRAEVQCEVFPALYAGLRLGRPGEPLVDANDASCFFHPEKRAALACEACGRFLCALCDLELHGRHICPSCLAAGRKKGSLGALDHFRLSWGGIALLVAVVPVIAFWPMTIVSAPAAIVVAIIGWRRPPSLTGRRRWASYTFALIFALTEIGAWVWALIQGFSWWTLPMTRF